MKTTRLHYIRYQGIRLRLTWGMAGAGAQYFATGLVAKFWGCLSPYFWFDVSLVQGMGSARWGW